MKQFLPAKIAIAVVIILPILVWCGSVVKQGEQDEQRRQQVAQCQQQTPWLACEAH